MIKRFNDRKEYNKYRSNNKDFIDIRNNFFNGYALRDKYNLITDELIDMYGLIDDTGDIIDQATGEVTKDYTRYTIKDIAKLKRLISENINFICLYSEKCEI